MWIPHPAAPELGKEGDVRLWGHRWCLFPMALPGNPADGFVAPKWDPLYQTHLLPRGQLIPLCYRALLGRCGVQGSVRASAHRDLLWSMFCCVGEVLIIACNLS